MVSSTVDPGRDRATGELLSKDTLYGLLSDRRRRTVLYQLDERENPVSLAELARVIVLEETGSNVDAPSEALRRVRISLHHVHLPKLSDAGAVAFDRADGTAELIEDGRGALTLLEAIESSP